LGCVRLYDRNTGRRGNAIHLINCVCRTKSSLYGRQYGANVRSWIWTLRSQPLTDRKSWPKSKSPLKLNFANLRFFSLAISETRKLIWCIIFLHFWLSQGWKGPCPNIFEASDNFRSFYNTFRGLSIQQKPWHIGIFLSDVAIPHWIVGQPRAEATPM
jgi:hypothetical protein